jgi:hypothetical protein
MNIDRLGHSTNRLDEKALDQINFPLDKRKSQEIEDVTPK